MRIETTGGALRAAATWVGRITPGRPMMPVLGGVLLAATDDGAAIHATDLDLFGTTHLTGAVIQPSRAVVSARLLGRIADVIPTGADVTIGRDSKRGRIVIKTGRNSWGLPEIDTHNWPVFPDPGDTVGTIGADELRRGLARVLPAAPTGDREPLLQVVEFTPDPTGTLTLAATDRQRVATADLGGWQHKTDPPAALLTPVGLLRAALDALKASGGDVSVATDGNTVTLECGPARVTGRLSEGFKPWRSAMADPDTLTLAVVVVDVAKLNAAVQGAALVCQPDDAVVVAFGPDGAHVTPERDNPDGDADQHATLIAFTGRPAIFKIAPRYLTDALAGVDEAAAELRFAQRDDVVRAVLLRPVAADGVVLGDYRHLIACRGDRKPVQP